MCNFLSSFSVRRAVSERKFRPPNPTRFSLISHPFFVAISLNFDDITNIKVFQGPINFHDPNGGPVMRKLGFFLSFAVLILISVALVEGQQPGQRGGGFGGVASNPLTLLNNKDVKKELEITDEQSTKIPAEVMVAISKVLNEKQFKRFKQIQLQQRGNNAFSDETVQAELKITADQKTSIAGILEASTKELGELKGGGGKGGFGKGNAEKTEKIRTDAREKILAVLTKDQRKTWSEMTGAEFKMTTGFGGGTFNKKGTDPKKTTSFEE
jgi:hypothetical protein